MPARRADTLLFSLQTFYLNGSSWSPGGDLLAYEKNSVVMLDAHSAYSNPDIWMFRLKDGKSEPFLSSTRFSEMYPEFSPDGRWIAYVSDESGQVEVYVQSYPDRSRKFLISNGGGSTPCWSRDGRQLYFYNKNRLMAVDVAVGPVFSTPRAKLDHYGYYFKGNGNRTFDVHPDGQRFLAAGDISGGKPIATSEIPSFFTQALGAWDRAGLSRFEYWLRSDPRRKLSPSLERRLREPTVTQINIVQNWFEELKRLVPAAKN